MEVFFGEERKKLEDASKERSLFEAVNDWLERTPGLDENGFNFFGKFQTSVRGMLDQEALEAQVLIQMISKNKMFTKRSYCLASRY